MEPTAAERYAFHKAEIEKKIAKLQKAMKRHEAEFLERNKNWGFVGDLEHISQKLSELSILGEEE